MSKRFDFEVPSNGQRQEAVPEALPAATAPVSPVINILIVDDEPKNLTVLETVLENCGYRLVRALSADQALLALVAEEFALLILDISMPGMNGFELAHMIKERKKTSQVPIIFLTAHYSGDEHILEGYETGAVDYLHKPVNPAILRSKVAVFAELYRKQCEIELVNRALLAEVFERRRAYAQLGELNDTLEQRVTDRTEALQASMALLRAVTDNVSLGLVTFDHKYHYKFSNPAYSKLFDLPEDIAGRHVAELLAPVYAEQLIRSLDRAFAGERIGYELNRPADAGASGQFNHYSLTYEPERDCVGNITGVVLVVFDTTERKRAELALRESEEKFRNALSNAAIGFALTTSGGAVVDANSAFCRLIGYSLNELRSLEFSQLIHPDDYAEDLRLTGQMLAGEIPDFVVENRYLPKHGDAVWVRKSLSTASDEIGKPKWITVLVEDVTERRMAESELRRLNLGLEDRIREEVQARHEAQTLLAQAEKLAALGQLAGGVAHDFNNILQAVSGCAGQLLRHAEDPATVKRFSHMIEDAGRRGTSVTRRLLALAHRSELRPEPVDVAALLDSLREVLCHTLGSNIGIRLHVPAALPPALTDRSQFETVLVNLATNARDAMSTGGTITISAKAETVSDHKHPYGLAQGAYLCLAVADTGSGMDAETLTHAMEPFFTTKASGEGTGLGLPMARSFAEQSGGALVVDSEPGQGTTVTLWLPAALAAAKRSVMAEDAAVPPAADRRRILLVDDEELVREVLAEELSDRDYDVIHSESGTTALALLDAGELVDLLVSDLAMPEMDGLSLIREFQRRRPNLPAILLTGYVGEAAAIAVGKVVEGPIGLLRKPASGAELADQIATMLEAKVSVNGLSRTGK